MKRKLNKFTLVLVDIILINLAYLLALYIKFEGLVDTQLISYLPRYLENAIYITIIKLGIFYYFKMYSTVWRYVSVLELYNIVTAIILSNASVLSFLFVMQANLPRSIYILTTLIDLSLIGGFRLILRDFHRNIDTHIKKKDRIKRVMIIGAGEAGLRIIRESIDNSHFNLEPALIIDDDIKKQGEVIEGIPVVGGRQSILSAAGNYHIDEIIIAIPFASNRESREIIDICKETRCKVKILENIYEPIDGDLSIEMIRDIEIDDSLEKEEIKLDIDEISPNITGKVVMVIVGGSSLDIELSRQIVGFEPKELIILNTYPNSSYEIENKLKRIFPDLNFKVINCSLIDKFRIDEIYLLEKPEVIFHTLDKYTSFMEVSPKEAINNDVFTTLNLVQGADLYKVEKFIMISKDKVVDPRNIVDASKIICDMIIQSMNKSSKTEYMVVGLGSVGSISDNIPPFPMEYRFLLKYLGELKRLINEGKDEDVIDYVKHMVANYKGSNELEEVDENKYA